MNLLTLIENLDLTLVAGEGAADLSDLTDDSRRVTPGGLFIARDTGDARWRDYTQTAIQNGASAVIAPAPIEAGADISCAVGAAVDQAMAGRLAARFFGEPAKKLKLIGITGTNGKTTVATLTQYLLNTAGVKTGLLGTVAIDHGSPEGPIAAELTTPGAIDLHRHFAAMVAHGCIACAMEVSSHALDQGRVDGLEFDVAVFTNLTQDHLDYHGTMENYAAAKAKLFAMLKPTGGAIVNGDDAASALMLKSNRASLQTLVRPRFPGSPAVALRTDGQLVAHIEELRAEGSVVLVGFDEVLGHDHAAAGASLIRVRLPTVGRHNVSNMLQALGAAGQIDGVDDMEALIQGLSKAEAVPGRLEPVSLDGQPTPAVLVDYAHTPDALENVLHALRPLIAEGGKLIVVFGCGGDRDRRKRPLMARAACGLADVAVLTSDNPRTEDPQQILDDAIAGVPPEVKGKLVVEIDRAKAIESAILGATRADTVLIAGKGHEDYQILGTTKIHFDDREQAAVALKKWVEQKKPRDGDPSALEGGNP